MSDEDIEKMLKLKQGVIAPETYDQMIKQGSIWQSNLEIFYGDDGLLPFKVSKFIDQLKTLERRIEAESARDKMFCSGILFSAGLRVYNYLVDCRGATARSDVSNSALDFSSLLDKIRNQEFTPRLPACFKLSGPKNKRKLSEVESDDEESVGDDRRTRKRGKRRQSPGKSKPSVDRNTDPVEAWILKDGESWDSFKGDNAKGRPWWDEANGTLMCHKFHIKGACWKDCQHKASHQPQGKIPADKKSAFGAWRSSKVGGN
jgi:hypothetical protein